MPTQHVMIADASMLCASLRSFHDFGIDAPAHTANYPGHGSFQKNNGRAVSSRAAIPGLGN